MLTAITEDGSRTQELRLSCWLIYHEIALARCYKGAPLHYWYQHDGHFLCLKATDLLPDKGGATEGLDLCPITSGNQ